MLATIVQKLASSRRQSSSKKFGYPLNRGQKVRVGFATVAIVGTLIGCTSKPPNNTLTIDTAPGRVTHTGPIQTPLGSQPIAGQWQANITSGTVQPFGSITSFTGVSTPLYGNTSGSGGILGLPWPTSLVESNILSPAYWNIEWSHSPACLSQNPPYPPLQNPALYLGLDFEPPSNSEGIGLTLTCWTNTPLNPDFVASNVSPQFALDDAVPPTLTVAAFDPIQAPSSITDLHVFGTDLSNPANVTAFYVASGGVSATFPYPSQSNGSALPAGAYITTITTDPSLGPQTTNGMEPFYVGHDDTTFAGAYGVAIASPQVVKTLISFQRGSHNVCFPGTPTETTTGGTPLPLVTLITHGQLAVGSSGNVIAVGANPTVVLPFNDNPVTTYSGGQNCIRP